MMVEKIQNEELKQYVKEELSYGFRWLSHEDNEQEETVLLEGIGDFNKRVFWNKEEETCFNLHICKKTSELINFSTWSENMRDDIAYYLNRDYNFVSMDNFVKPTFVTLYSTEYEEFVEIEFQTEGKWNETRIYDNDKIKSFHNLIKTIENFKEV